MKHPLSEAPVVTEKLMAGAGRGSRAGVWVTAAALYLCTALLVSAHLAVRRLDAIATAATETKASLEQLQAMDQRLTRNLHDLSRAALTAPAALCYY